MIGNQEIRKGLGKNRANAITLALELNRAETYEELERILASTDRRKIARFLFDTVRGKAENKSIRWAQSTVQSYRSKIKVFIHFLAKEHRQLIYLHQVTPSIAKEYVQYREASLVSPSGKATENTKLKHPSARTVADDVSCLRSLFQHAVDLGLIGANPFQTARARKRPKEDKIPRNPMSTSQVQMLLEGARLYDSTEQTTGRNSTFRGMIEDMLKLLILTGLRKSELINLIWDKVDFDFADHGGLHIESYTINVDLNIQLRGARRTKISERASRRASRKWLFRSAEEAHGIVDKTYLTRSPSAFQAVPLTAWDDDSGILTLRIRHHWEPKATVGSVALNADARQILENRHKVSGSRSPFVFPHPDNGHLRSHLDTEFKKVLKLAQLKSDFTVHDLRRTFATLLRSKGASMEDLQGLLRHADIRDTQKYALIDPSRGALTVAKLDGLVS